MKYIIVTALSLFSITLVAKEHTGRRGHVENQNVCKREFPPPSIQPTGEDQTPSYRKYMAEENHASVTVLAFHATWCGPCQRLHPMIEKVIGEFCKAGKKVQLVFVDSDQAPALASEYNIQSLPTTLILKNYALADHGEWRPEDRIEGLVDEEKMKNAVDGVLNRRVGKPT